MATGLGLGDSLSNPLAYASEIAYVQATSTELNTDEGSTASEDDFSFTLTEQQLRSELEVGSMPAVEEVNTDAWNETKVSSAIHGSDMPSSNGSPAPKPFLRNTTEPDQQVLIVFGPSGWGRGRIVQKLVYSDPSLYAMVVSHTTRQKRPYEVNGRDMHFVSQKEMSSGIERRQFIAYTRVAKEELPAGSPKPLHPRADSVFDLTEDDSPSGEWFGTSWQALQEARMKGKPVVVLNMNTQGAQQVKDAGIEGMYILLYTSESSADTKNMSPDSSIYIDNPDQAISELKQFVHSHMSEVDLPKGQSDQEKWEWDLVPTVRIEKQRSPKVHQELTERDRIVSFNELLSHFQSKNIGQQLVTIKPDTRQRQGLFSHLFGKSKLGKKLQLERDTIFSIAQCPLNDRELLHLHTLQTIYKKLTGNKVNCPRIGRHWEDIGFQSKDPADDLRGVGFLGLMQLIYLLDDSRSFPLAREIYTYSRNDSNYVPFCVLSLNITQIALGVLREGGLNKECAKRDQVFLVFNEFYLATFHRYYQVWKKQSKTVHEVGPLLQEIGDYAKRNVKMLLREIQALLSEREEAMERAASFSRPSSENPFTPLEQ